MIRIGHISYANCTPIFHSMPRYPDFVFEKGVPAYLNSRLAAGELDICPSSSIEYAAHQDSYLIVPDLSISSYEKVLSVLLFSPVPVEELQGGQVVLTAESATSSNLLKVLLAKKYGITCSFRAAHVSPEEVLKSGSPTLLIGDFAIRAAMSRSEFYVYDLGQEWFQWTGLPFTFGLWLTRRDVAETKRDELIRVARSFQFSKQLAGSTLEQIAEDADESKWMGKQQLVEYWQHICYDLTPLHIQGLELFYELSADCGLIDKKPQLHFLEMTF